MDPALSKEFAVAQELPAKDKKPPLKLEVEQEDTVFEFTEAHPDLHHKGHTDFIKTHRKDALWQHLAVIQIKGHMYIS